MNNLKKIMCLVIFCMPLIIQAQDYKGIKWVTGLSWDQVKKKAKSEQKIIFLDMYATWCGPCKIMDRDIYPLAEVGEFYNKNFIAIRVQTDQTSNDNEDVKQWYEDSKNICAAYNVLAYPTFLFLAPDGKLIHRASGAFDKAGFTKLAIDAVSQRGYTVQIDAFKKGYYESINLKELANAAKFAGDHVLSKEIATVFVERMNLKDLILQENMVFIWGYGDSDKEWAKKVCLPKLSNIALSELANPTAIRFLLFAAQDEKLAAGATDLWLDNLKHKEVFTKEVLLHMKTFVRSSGDKAFALLYNNIDTVNEIMGEKEWINGTLADIIGKEEFLIPYLYPARKLIQAGEDKTKIATPNWKEIKRKIKKRYSKWYAEQLQFSMKIRWYNLIGNKKEYTKNIVAEMNRSNGWNLHGFVLNSQSMEVFRYSRIRKELLTAASWIKKYFDSNPEEFEKNGNVIDTYAILLYKAGKMDIAIELQEKAVKVDPIGNELASNLEKMKKRLPIWPSGYDVIK